jgi:hypothetical protein
MLLVQSLSTYTEQMLTVAKSGGAEMTTSSSIGPVVKRYCSQVTRLYTTVQQTMSDVSIYTDYVRRWYLH